MSRLRTLRDRRGQIVQQIRALANTAGEAALSAEQRTEYDRLWAEQETVAGDIQREERALEAERELQSSPEQRRAAGNGERTDENRGAQGLTDEELRAFDAEIDDAEDVPADQSAVSTGRRARRSERRSQIRAIMRENRSHARAQVAYRAAFRQWLRGGMVGVSADGQRALQAGTGAEGGYLVAPMQMAAGMIQAADNDVFLRSYATVQTVMDAASLGVVSLDADPDDGDWTNELATGSEDGAMAFGRRQMTPHPLAKRIKLSNKFLRAAASPEELVRSRLNYKFGITEEKNFLLGNGQAKPLGVFVASNDGVPTSRDVTAGSTTAITSAGLIAMKYGMRAAYRRKARWLFHRDAIKQIALLTDTTNVPIWLPSMRDGQPDTLLGHALDESEYTPNTFTTGLYVGMFADFSYYWIVDALTIQFQRLVELYAENNQTGIICRKETDGQPVLAEAFVRGKLA